MLTLICGFFFFTFSLSVKHSWTIFLSYLVAKFNFPSSDGKSAQKTKELVPIELMLHLITEKTELNRLLNPHWSGSTLWFFTFYWIKPLMFFKKIKLRWENRSPTGYTLIQLIIILQNRREENRKENIISDFVSRYLKRESISGNTHLIMAWLSTHFLVYPCWIRDGGSSQRILLNYLCKVGWLQWYTMPQADIMILYWQFNL